MSAEALEKLTDASNKLAGDLDKKYFRRMQGDMYRCSAKCCDDTANSMERVQNCIDRCQEPLLKAQTNFQNQIKLAQERLNRCITHCNDEANDQYQADSSTDRDMSAYSRSFEDCASNCVDNFIKNSLPLVSEKMEEGLSKGRFF